MAEIKTMWLRTFRSKHAVPKAMTAITVKNNVHIYLPGNLITAESSYLVFMQYLFQFTIWTDY